QFRYPPPRPPGAPATKTQRIPIRPALMAREIRPPASAPARPLQPIHAHYRIPSRSHRREVPSWSLFAAGIMFFCLVAIGFRVVSEPNRKNSPESRNRTSAEKNFKRTMIGVGQSEDDARLEALEKAKTEMIVYLRNINAPVEWIPSLEYIEKSLKLEWVQET